MMTHLLYPSNPLRPRQPDEQFAAEVDAVRNAGFEISLFSVENLQAGEFRPVPALPRGLDALYRGWMLSASEYETFCSALVQTGARPLVLPDAYVASHYLPNWYPHIKDLTPETRIYPPDCDLAEGVHSVVEKP